MRKLTVLLILAAFVVALVPSSAFALGHSFRNQATIGLWDDAADDITEGTDVIRGYPKWVLLTRFSNLLGAVSGGGGGASEDQILEYDTTASDGSTFYGLVGSSEWFETNLGMPVNFAFSYQRDGERTALLDYDGNGSAALVSTATGEGLGTTGEEEWTDRRNYANLKDTEWNATAGYKVNDSLWAGLTWTHKSAKAKLYNDGEEELVVGATTTTRTYSTGLAKDVLAAATEDKFRGIARMAMNDDMHVKGYLTLGYYTSQDNTADYETSTDIPGITPGTITGAPSLPSKTANVIAIYNGVGGTSDPVSVETSVTGAADTEANLTVSSKANGLIFGLKGKVYYYPLYKGSIESELGYEYRGGAISKTETLSDGTDDEVYSTSGKQTEHTLAWETERSIELENLEVVLGLYWSRSSVATNASVDWESDVGAGPDGSISINSKSVKHTWEFPVGAELAFKEVWSFRAGSDHSVALTTTTVNVTGEDGLAVGTEDDDYTTTTRSDTRTTAYKYGVGYAWSENLQLDINAFLEETPAGTATDRADILDLSTYRNLAISATLTF